MVNIADTIGGDLQHGAAVEGRLPVTARAGLQTEYEPDPFVADDPVVVMVMAHDNGCHARIQAGIQRTFFSGVAADAFVLNAQGIRVAGIPAAIAEAFFQRDSLGVQTAAECGLKGFVIAEDGMCWISAVSALISFASWRIQSSWLG